MKTINVKEYGALGNGKHNDTVAIQSAIDELDANNGGILFFPEGIYLCGTLILCSNISLTGNNATLSLVSDESYLKRIPFGPGNRFSESAHNYTEFDCNLGFLCASDKENICILNLALEADDRSFCEKVEADPFVYKEGAVNTPGTFFGDYYSYIPNRARPQMIFFNDCKNVSIDNIRIYKSPCFSAWLLRCENINVQNTIIRNNYNQYNADGFHFSSCKNVFVSNCDFTCGDDCIAIDTNSGGDANNYFIENCVFQTSMHAIRLYSGLDLKKVFGRKNSGTLSQVRFKNITVNGCGSIVIINAFDGDISDVKFDNVSGCEDAYGTAYCFTANEGIISDVTVCNSSIKGDGAVFGYADGNGQIRDILFENTDFEIRPVLKYWGVAEVCENASHAFGKPYNITLKGCQNIKFQNCSLRFEPPVFSDSFTDMEREKILKAIGEEHLKKIEPSFIPALSEIGCKDIDVSTLQVE